MRKSIRRKSVTEVLTSRHANDFRSVDNPGCRGSVTDITGSRCDELRSSDANSGHAGSDTNGINPRRICPKAGATDSIHAGDRAVDGGSRWRKSRARSTRPICADDCRNVKLPGWRRSGTDIMDAVWDKLRMNGDKSRSTKSKASRGSSHQATPKTGAAKPVQVRDLGNMVSSECKKSSGVAADPIQVELRKSIDKPKCKESSTEATSPGKARLCKGMEKPKCTKSGTSGSNSKRAPHRVAVESSGLAKLWSDKVKSILRKSIARIADSKQAKL